MGKISYVMGESVPRKDTVYEQLHTRVPELETIRIYTTHPIRDRETDGVEYFFVDDGWLEQCRENGTLIECRIYDMMYGLQNYFTVDDEQIDLEHSFYLVMGTLKSYERMRSFYGSRALVPLCAHVEDGLRLRRALERERQQKVPRYKEMCRRFLADEEDFKLEDLERCGIGKWYQNVVLEDCLKEIIDDIGMFMGGGKQRNAENN